MKTKLLLLLIAIPLITIAQSKSEFRVKINGDSRVYKGAEMEKGAFSEYSYHQITLKGDKFSDNDSFTFHLPLSVIETGDRIRVQTTRSANSIAMPPSMEYLTELEIQYTDIYGLLYMCSRDMAPSMVNDDIINNVKFGVKHDFLIDIIEYNPSEGKLIGRLNGYININGEDIIKFTDGEFTFSTSRKRVF